MSGGLAFIWDPDNRLPGLVNRDTVALRRPDLAAETQLRTLVELHAARTHSRHARQLLDRWSQTCAEAWLVEPKAGLG
jgi:glutamate synthase domain-containing protein 3